MNRDLCAIALFGVTLAALAAFAQSGVLLTFVMTVSYTHLTLPTKA